MVHIESRRDWGARYKNGSDDLHTKATRVFIHHTAGTHLPADATVARERQVMRQIEQIGKDRFGTGMSYNVIVFPSGRAYQGVDFDRKGAHTLGLNSTVRAICFAGNYSVKEPTLAQLKTASEIYRAGEGVWWNRDADVDGHRDNPRSRSECPGNYLYPLVERIESGYYLGANVEAPLPAPAPDKAENVGNDRGTLARGSHGNRVKSLQAFMNARLGARLDVDGSFGPATVEAVTRWQVSVKLKGDGRVGPATVEVLRRLGWDEKSTSFSTPKPVAPKPVAPKPAPKPVAPKPSAPVKSIDTLHRGVKNSTVRSLQQFMNKTFPSYSKLDTDGSFGPATEAVIKNFQGRVGLARDGRVGPATQAKLRAHGWKG